MTTSYTPSDLATSAKDQIRFNLGDTDSVSFQLQDEEIDWAFALRGTTWGATAMCALALSAKYSRLTSISADGVSQGLQQKATAFALLAKEYERKEAIMDVCLPGLKVVGPSAISWFIYIADPNNPALDTHPNLVSGALMSNAYPLFMGRAFPSVKAGGKP